MAEERKTLLAEEHANIERLLTAISASINRDLPQRMNELLRTQLAAWPQSLPATAVQPAVQAALAAVLPAELSSAALQVCVVGRQWWQIPCMALKNTGILQAVVAYLYRKILVSSYF